MTEPTRFPLALGMDLAGAAMEEVWWRYLGNGGVAAREVLAGRIAGTVGCDRAEYNLIAQTLNECFLDRGVTTFPVGYDLAGDWIRPERQDVRRRDSDAPSALRGRADRWVD